MEETIQKNSFSGLPKIQENNVTKTLIFGDNIVVIRPWKTKDERNFLIKKATLPKGAQDSDDKIQSLVINELVKPCIISGNVDILSVNQFKMIMFELRTISIGEMVEGITFKCKHCGTTNTIDIEIDDNLVKYENGNSELCEINKDLSLRFKQIPFKIVNSKTEEIDFIYNSIEEVVYLGESYKTFTKREFEDFLDSLDLKTTKKMFEKLQECMDKLTIVKTVTCINCKENMDIDFGETPNFYIP